MKRYSVRHDKAETRTSMRRDGKIALGISLGCFGTVITIVVIDLLFRETLDPNLYLEFAPVFVSLIVAMASTFIATSALREQRITRQAGTDPVLIAHLGQREDARIMITFKVSNVGAGAALNVHMEVEKPADTPEDFAKREFLQDIFKPREPFSAILQDQSIEFSLSTGPQLLGQKKENSQDPRIPLNPLPPFRVKLSYEDLSGGQYEGEFYIDIQELAGMSANRTPIMRAVNALEKNSSKIN